MDGAMKVVGFNKDGREVSPGIELTTWSELKFARAVTHANDLQSLARSWDAGGHTWLEFTVAVDSLSIDARLRVSAQPPIDEFALRLGDLLHNLRSALDSLAWELCFLDAAPAQRLRRGIYFPAVMKAEDWEAKAKALPMPDEFLKRLREVQPFSITGRVSPLGVLAALSNQDKHRGAIGAKANAAQFSLPMRFVQPTTDPDAKGDLRTEFHQEGPMSLVDELPFLTARFDRQVDVTQAKSPVGLQYVVSFDGAEYELFALIASLLSIHALMDYVRTGLWPGSGTTMIPESVEVS